MIKVLATALEGKPERLWVWFHCIELSYLPVENDAPDEPQGQFMIPIYNVSSSYVHQLNLEMEKIWIQEP